MTQSPVSRALWVAFGAITVGATLSLSAAWAQTPTLSLGAGIHVIRAELAANNDTRMRGLMFRKSLEPNQGMLFVFDESIRHCMWMKNTPLPLSVAFIDEGGGIINIEDMQPQTLEAHCAKKPARYALEMNQGWFKSKNIKAGNKVSGLPK